MEGTEFTFGDNIKVYLIRPGGCGLDDLAQDRHRWREFVNAVMNLRGSIKCGEFLD